MSSVRQAFDDLRYRWLDLRIGGPDATLRGHWVVLSLSLVLVFACFFAIGRYRSGGGGGSPGAGPSTLASPSGQAAIPTGLSGGPPIAGAVPVAIAVKPRPRPEVQPAPSSEPAREASAQSLTTGETSGSESASESPSASAPAPESAPQPKPEPTPTKAAAPSHGGGGSGASGPRSPQGASKPSGGASFDSSE